MVPRGAILPSGHSVARCRVSHKPDGSEAAVKNLRYLTRQRSAQQRFGVPLGFFLAVALAADPGPSAQSKWRLEPGDPLPPLVGADIAGNPVTFDFRSQDRPTVVYSIAPFSKYVSANEKRFAALVKQAHSRFRFVVLIPEHNPRTADYIAQIRSGWGDANVVVITDVSKALYHSMFLGAYPTTFVVSPTSAILRTFMGAYDENSLSARPGDIEAFFGVTLPRS